MNDQRRWIVLGALIATLLLARVACIGGPGNGLNLAKVRGRVTFQGEPLRAGEVLFVPDKAKGTVGPPAAGSIGEDGRYVLSTERSCDGALVGAHRVALLGRERGPEAGEGTEAAPPSAARPSKEPVGPRLLTPVHLADPATSKVEVEVGRGSNSIDFEIQASGDVFIGR